MHTYNAFVYMLLSHRLSTQQITSHTLTLNPPAMTTVAPLRKAKNTNNNFSCLSFGNADRALSFYLTAQCLNIERIL
jgi:hypothetical protein